MEKFDSSTASDYTLSGKCDSSLGENVEISVIGADITDSATCNSDNTFTVDLDGSSLTLTLTTSTITFQATYSDETVNSNSIMNRNIQFQSISSREEYTCALTTNGNVKCWGKGESRQLGNGAANNSSTPVDVHTSFTDSNPLSDIAAISAGSYHNCALTTNEKVKCWGTGSSGRLGNGADGNSSTPVDVHTSFTDSDPLSDIDAISSGGFHTCALTTNGKVKCWGNGGSGRLGNGADGNSPTPVDVHTSSEDTNPLSGIDAISSGGWHTCALTTNGKVKCWGNGGSGRLGNGAEGKSSTPIDVHTSFTDPDPLSDIAAISAGGYHTCALTTNKKVKCWGNGGSGRLGNGAEDKSSTPIDVHTSFTDPDPLSDIAAISAGGYHTCALTTNKKVKCWGAGSAGKLGNGADDNSLTPVDVHTSSTDPDPLSDIAAISVGSYHTCALTTNRNIKCWGAGSSGKLGNGADDNSSTPVDILLP